MLTVQPNPICGGLDQDSFIKDYSTMSSYLKSLRWNRKTLAPDLTAGLTVTLVSIPEGMAYALVAGVDPV